MDEFFLFTDGSINTRTKVGYGAYLFLNEMKYQPDILKPRIELKRFENTSSTRLEIQTHNHAIHELPNFKGKLFIYSDSQNIVSLPSRRERLEKNNFCSTNGRLLNHAKLYLEFYNLIDKYNFFLIKVKGHTKSNEKNEIERIFSLVDKASRKALRSDIYSME